MLGLGRAIGETIAVTIVIGNAPEIGKQLFDQGYTLAAVIANEFGEAADDPLHRGALIAAGLVLFVLTLLVNAIARAARQPRRARAGAAGAGADAPQAAGRERRRCRGRARAPSAAAARPHRPRRARPARARRR